MCPSKNEPCYNHPPADHFFFLSPHFHTIFGKFLYTKDLYERIKSRSSSAKIIPLVWKTLRERKERTTGAKAHLCAALKLRQQQNMCTQAGETRASTMKLGVLYSTKVSLIITVVYLSSTITVLFIWQERTRNSIFTTQKGAYLLY